MWRTVHHHCRFDDQYDQYDDNGDDDGTTPWHGVQVNDDELSFRSHTALSGWWRAFARKQSWESRRQWRGENVVGGDHDDDLRIIWIFHGGEVKEFLQCPNYFSSIRDHTFFPRLSSHIFCLFRVASCCYTLTCFFMWVVKLFAHGDE